MINDMTNFDNLVDAVRGYITAEPSPYGGNQVYIEGVVSRVIYEGNRIRFVVIPPGEEDEVDGPDISSQHCTWWSEVDQEGAEWNIGSVVIDDHFGSRRIVLENVRLRPKHRKVTGA